MSGNLATAHYVPSVCHLIVEGLPCLRWFVNLYCALCVRSLRFARVLKFKCL